MKNPVSKESITKLIDNPVATFVYRAFVTLATFAIAAAAWWNRSYATLPDRVALSEVGIEAHSVEIAATKSDVGKLSQSAQEAARMIASLQMADENIRADVRAGQAAQTALRETVLLTQAQGAEQIRRLDGLDRKLEKIGDRLGVP